MAQVADYKFVFGYENGNYVITVEKREDGKCWPFTEFESKRAPVRNKNLIRQMATELEVSPKEVLETLVEYGGEVARVKDEAAAPGDPDHRQIEVDWHNRKPHINPALDFHKDKAYVTQTLPVDSGERISVVIRSDGEVEYLCNGNELSFVPLAMPGLTQNRWSLPSIRQFTTDGGPAVTLPEAYNAIKEQYDAHMDFSSPEDSEVMALWCLGTYFFPLFNTYPYIFVNAVKRSGKTKLLTLTSMMAFNARPGLSQTPATLYRLIQCERSTLLVDENEKLTNKKDESDFRSMLLAGYKKGMSVPRTAERKEGDVKTFSVEDFDLYGPKMLANISGIEDVLEDRCITLILKRTQNAEKGNKEVDLVDPTWPAVRDKVYLAMMQNFSDVVSVVCEGKPPLLGLGEGVCFSKGEEGLKELGEDPLREIQRKNSILGSTLYTNSTNYTNSPLTNRDYELWKPLLTIAKLIDPELLKRIHEYAAKKCRERAVEDLADTWDVVLAEVLQEMVETDKWVEVKTIASQHCVATGEEGEDKDWQRTVKNRAKWVGRALKRLGVVLEKRRHSKGIEVRMIPSTVRDMAARLGVAPAEPKGDPQTQLEDGTITPDEVEV